MPPMQLGKVSSFIKKHRLFNKGDTVVVAVSGGPDSSCLLHLLCRLRDELCLKLIVAHLNHGLRPEAGHEALGVEKIAKSRSIPFEVKAVEIRSYRKELGLSEEEAGRRARYDFLFEVARKYGASRIALGHHLDDQAETVLLNLIRGTGVDGLAGMLPRRKRGRFQLVRPLLCLRRREIDTYCRENKLLTFTDSSNLETDYTRNRLRLELIPHLEQRYNPRISEALYNLASLAADDRRFLQAMARKKHLELSTFCRGKTVVKRPGLMALPAALKGRVLRHALKRFVSAKKISRLHIEQLLTLAEKGRTGSYLTLPGGAEAYCSYNNLVLNVRSGKPAKPFTAVTLKVPGKTYLPGGFAITARVADAHELPWPPHSCRAYLDYDEIPAGALKVRPRWRGARFYPQGSPGSKKLKDFLIDQKIAAERRDTLPLVTAGEMILWVVGVRIAHPYRVTGQTGKVLVLEYRVQKQAGKKVK